MKILHNYNPGIATLLALLFPPIGLAYVSFGKMLLMLFLVMIIVFIIAFDFIFGFVLYFIWWIACGIMANQISKRLNAEQEERMRQHTVGQINQNSKS